MKKSIIFLVCCLSTASIHPAKRLRGQDGDQNKRPQSRQRVAQNRRIQQEALQNHFLTLPLDMLVVIFQETLNQATTRESFVKYVLIYSKLQQVCKLWNNLLQRKECAYLDPQKTPYAKNLIAHMNDSNIQTRGTLLHEAAENGHIADVMILLKGGANMEAANKNGRTPLHLAARNGHTEIVEALLDAGADIEAANDNDRTPFHLPGLTALHFAAQHGHAEVVKALIKKGATIDAQDGQRRTPLHWAALHGHIKVTIILIKGGANVNIQNNDGETLLHYAAMFGKSEVVRILVENDAHIDTKNKRGETPLHWATWHGHAEVVKVLIKMGAEIEAQNQEGKTPLDLATRRSHTEIAKLLRTAIAKEAQAYDKLIAWLNELGT